MHQNWEKKTNKLYFKNVIFVWKSSPLPLACFINLMFHKNSSFIVFDKLTNHIYRNSLTQLGWAKLLNLPYILCISFALGPSLCLVSSGQSHWIPILIYFSHWNHPSPATSPHTHTNPKILKSRKINPKYVNNYFLN